MEIGTGTEAIALSVGTSALLLVGSVLVVRYAIVRLPPEHFLRPRNAVSRARRYLRIGIGSALIVAGVAMLVLPGQGLLTILIGVTVLELPVARRVELWALRRPAVFAAANALRARAGKPPFVLPS